MNNSILISYSYLILNVFLLFIIIILSFLLFRANRRARKKISKESSLSDFLEPMKFAIDTLQVDKIRYLDAFKKEKKEKELYSNYILNILGVGVVLFDEKEIIYKNEWFENNQLDFNKLLTEEKSSFELKKENIVYLINRKKYKNYLIFVISDVSDIKNLEQEIIKKERLYYLGEMSSYIAHEFKNSLTAIKGFNSIIKKKSDNADIILSVSKDIEEEINYFYMILTDYLSYSKEINLIYSLFSFKELLEDIIVSVFYNNKNNIDIKGSIDLYADRDKIKQVIINLIKNALEVSTKVVVSMKKSDKYSIIEIIDFGVGIGLELKEKIFNPFFTSKEHGTGLGLSISYNIMTAHNSKIEVLDNTPSGSIFRLSFKNKY